MERDSSHVQFPDLCHTHNQMYKGKDMHTTIDS